MKFEKSLPWSNKLTIVYTAEDSYNVVSGKTKFKEIKAIFDEAVTTLRAMACAGEINECEYLDTFVYVDDFYKSFKLLYEIGKTLRKEGVKNTRIPKPLKIEYSAQCVLRNYIAELMEKNNETN